MSLIESLESFKKQNSREWRQIASAQDLAQDTRNKIKAQSNSGSINLFPSDVDLVVFGSMARNEFTNGSDVDWTLLVDGQANAHHLGTAHYIEEIIQKAEQGKPGNTGMFGQITFSHDLIHYIGGEDDTNHNLSRRILLLLESDKLSLRSDHESKGTAYERVLRGIIQQYVHNDSGFSGESGKDNVPRFLLNDIVRFWRTMCVDFAYKQREQKGKKWALRNIKLRMSRKLIFVKGLLMCFSCYKNELQDTNALKDALYEAVMTKPINFIYTILMQNGIDKEHIISLFDSYDKFLGMLNDIAFREHMEKLPMDKAYGDLKFEEARQNSHQFQEALNNIFIKQETPIREFVLKYGVF